MSQRNSSIRAWVWRLWAVGVVQEVVEAWAMAWLVSKFRSPYLCRVSVTDGRWCMVPSLTQVAARRVPAFMCQYDAWCGELVYLETAPPLITRLTVLFTALVVSLLVVWAPRILTYRPSHPLLVCARRHTPRRVLVLVAASSVLQLTLDHCLFAIVLPPRLLLTRLASVLSFVIAHLLMTAVMVKVARQPPATLRTIPQIKVTYAPATPSPSEVPVMDHSEEHQEFTASRSRPTHFSPHTP